MLVQLQSMFVSKSDSLESDAEVECECAGKCVCRNEEAWWPETEGEEGAGGRRGKVFAV